MRHVVGGRWPAGRDRGATRRNVLMMVRMRRGAKRLRQEEVAGELLTFEVPVDLDNPTATHRGLPDLMDHRRESLVTGEPRITLLQD